jgi:hypothetical protein
VQGGFREMRGQTGRSPNLLSPKNWGHSRLSPHFLRVLLPGEPGRTEFVVHEPKDLSELRREEHGVDPFQGLQIVVFPF